MNKGEESDDNYNKPIYIGKIIGIVVMIVLLIGIIWYAPNTFGNLSNSDRKSINQMIIFLVISLLFYIINLIIGIVYYENNTEKDKNMSFAYLIITIIILVIFALLSFFYISHIVYSIKRINKNIADASGDTGRLARREELAEARRVANEAAAASRV